MSQRNVPEDKLLDSAVSLRLADEIARELGGAASDEASTAGGSLKVLQRAYSEILNMHQALHRSRTMIEHATGDRIQSTHSKLAEVTSVTETAANNILNALDRALRHVDRLEQKDAEAGAIPSQIRDELHHAIGALQFQDIAAQQLGYAGAVLKDLEDRMQELAGLIDQNLLLGDVPSANADAASATPAEAPAPAGTAIPAVKHDVFDPGASIADRTSRQAVADEIFLRR